MAKKIEDKLGKIKGKDEPQIGHIALPAWMIFYLKGWIPARITGGL